MPFLVTNLDQDLEFTEDTILNLDNIVIDDDGEIYTVRLTLSNPAAGSLTPSSATDTDPDDGIWEATGTAAALNLALQDLHFDPAANWDQDVSIAVEIVHDTNGVQNGTISLTAIPVNDAPAISYTASIVLAEDAPTTLTSFEFSDVDAGSSSVTATLKIATGALSATSGDGVTVGGTANDLTLTGSIANINAYVAAGGVTYTPDANDNGQRSLEISINDGGATGGGTPYTATVNQTLNILAVNDAPVATTPASISVTEDTPAALTGISFSDVDAGSGNVTATFSIAAGSLSAISGAGVTVGGTTSVLTLTGSISDINAYIAAEGLTYEPAADDYGTRVLSVSINDGGNTGTGGAQTDTKTIDLDIAPVNDAPVADAPAAISIRQGVTTELTGISFSDVDARDADVTVTLNVMAGDLSASSGDGVIVGGTPTTMTLTGSIAAINAYIADGQVAYSPGSGDMSRALTVTIDDGGNTGGPPQTDSYVVNLQIDVNIPPALTTPASIGVTEDTATALTGISVGDDDGDTLTVTLGIPAGALSATSGDGVIVGGVASALTLSGTAADINAFIAAGGVNYDPAADDVGTYVLTVEVDDGRDTETKTIDIEIANVNDDPTGAVTISGVPQVGQTLTANTSTLADADGLGDLVYEWIVGGEVKGDGASLVIDADMLGKPVSVTVSYEDGYGTQESLASTSVTIVSTPSPEPEPEPGNVTETVVIDGRTIQTETFTGPDGQPHQTVNVPASTDPNLSPLQLELLQSQLLIQLPSGVGLNATGPTGLQNATQTLQHVLNTTNAGSFVPGLDAYITQSLAPLSLFDFVVQTVQFLPGDFAPVNPLIISAATETLTALFLEMGPDWGFGPPTVNLDNVDFAMILGAATVTGGEGAQIVFADASSQTLFLGEGDDELHGGGGADTVGSQGGNDSLFGDEGDDSVFGGEGDDHVFGGADADTVHGNAGDDFVHGNAGDDLLYGGKGDDIVRGGQGNDVVFGDLGDDLVFGDLGDDRLDGGDGNDFVHGNQGADTIFGGAGSDILYGGQGNDHLEGGDGNDTLSGDRGDDVLTGGAGSDTFLLFAGAGSDRVTDFTAADQVILAPGIAFNLRQEGADTIIDLGEEGRMVLTGVQFANLPEGWLMVA